MKITRAWWFFLTAYFSFSVINCPQLTTPPKAVPLTVPCTSTYRSNCSYSCQTGYTSLTGNVTRTCLSSGNWSGSDIRCTGNYSHIKCVFNFMTSVTFNVPSQAHVSSVRLAFLLITQQEPITRSVQLPLIRATAFLQESLFLDRLFPRKLTVVAWTFSQSAVSKMISISLCVNHGLSPMK